MAIIRVWGMDWKVRPIPPEVAEELSTLAGAVTRTTRWPLGEYEAPLGRANELVRHYLRPVGGPVKRFLYKPEGGPIRRFLMRRGWLPDPWGEVPYDLTLWTLRKLGNLARRDGYG